jgi:hypothetical protein
MATSLVVADPEALRKQSLGGEAITTPPRAALVLCLLLFSREPHDSLYLALGRRTSYIVVSRIC